MHEVLEDDLINTLPLGAPGLNRFEIGSFLKDKFWKTQKNNLPYATDGIVVKVDSFEIQNLLD